MSQAGAGSSSQIRFGDFEVDVRAGELRRAGARVSLPQQAFRALAHLVNHAGDVITREELRRELWADDTFVDFEHGLNVTIARVREVLGDDADQPRYIETLPKRGYRFIAHVEAPVETPEGRAECGQRIHVWAGIALLLVVVATIGAMQLWRPPVLTDRDTILVADFVNKTGEEVFDDTLRQVVTIALEQTPFLSVVSRERVGSVMKQMMRPPDERVLGDLARELCQRASATLRIDGGITRIETRYVITLEAVGCESGDIVASEQLEAPDREHVVHTIGTMVGRLRAHLGESRATLRRFDRPLQEATTRSLDALKAFTVGEEIRARNGVLRAEPFYRHATDLDPQFALAHARLSVVYMTTSRRDEMRRSTERAYALRGRVTERERLYIEYRACAFGASDDCGYNVGQLWKQAYPRDWAPYQILSYFYKMRGEFEKAVENGVESVRLGPDTYMTYGTLVDAYLALNRFDDACRTMDTALERHIDTPVLHAQRFTVAFAAGDRQIMAREAQAISSGDDVVEASQGPVDANAAAFEGRLNAARKLWSRAEQVGSDDWREGMRAERAMVDAAVGVYHGLAGVAYTWNSSRDAAIAMLLAGDHASASAWLRASRLDERPPAQRPPYFDRARVLLKVVEGDRSAIQ